MDTNKGLIYNVNEWLNNSEKTIIKPLTKEYLEKYLNNNIQETDKSLIDSLKQSQLENEEPNSYPVESYKIVYLDMENELHNSTINISATEEINKEYLNW